MVYPINIFENDKESYEGKSFMVLIPGELPDNAHNAISSFKSGHIAQGFKDLFDDLLSYKFPMVLPLPDGGVTDASANSYEELSSGKGIVNKTVGSGIDKVFSSVTFGLADKASARLGVVPDPKLTQTYTGTGPRSFSATWTFTPKSFVEASSVLIILGYVRYCAAPESCSAFGGLLNNLASKIPGLSSFSTTGYDYLKPPYLFKIFFSNPLLQFSTQYDRMAISDYSINYFSQGYSNTYYDGIPKQMQLTINFKEWGIKTKADWNPLTYATNKISNITNLVGGF